MITGSHRFYRKNTKKHTLHPSILHVLGGRDRETSFAPPPPPSILGSRVQRVKAVVDCEKGMRKAVSINSHDKKSIIITEFVCDTDVKLRLAIRESSRLIKPSEKHLNPDCHFGKNKNFVFRPSFFIPNALCGLRERHDNRKTSIDLIRNAMLPSSGHRGFRRIRNICIRSFIHLLINW